MTQKLKAADTSYIDFCGGPEQAVRAAYKEGAAAQRAAWAAWFDSLPISFQAAIQRHRQRIITESTFHKDGSITIFIPPDPNK